MDTSSIRTIRPRRREKTQTTTSGDGEDGASGTKPSGGIHSINNQAGHPYIPLGEPILDFVFQVKRKKGTHGTTNEQEEKEQQKDDTNKSEHVSKKLPPSNSLDLTDPVRDLLALCTPRRADVIDASAAIRERVVLSEARIKTVKAGGTFEEIDRCLKGRRRLKEFQAKRADSDANQLIGQSPRASLSAPSGFIGALRSTSSRAPTIDPSDAALGSSLMQSTFLNLAKRLNDGSISVTTAPSLLQKFAAEKLGGPFAPNFEGNLFKNLPAHPLLAPSEPEKRSVGSPPDTRTASQSPNGQTRRMEGIPPLHFPSQGSSTARSSPPSFAQTARAFTDRSATVGNTQQTPAHLLPLRNPHAPPASLSFHALRYTLHQSFGTLHTKEVEMAAAQKRREKLAELAANARNAPPIVVSAPSSPTSTSRRGRSRIKRGLESTPQDASHPHHPPTQQPNPDREYTKAVASSKYRREHNNSPTSHWMRLQEMVSQRTQQARALNNMAYFDPEGQGFVVEGSAETKETNTFGQTISGNNLSSPSNASSSGAKSHRSPRKTNIHAGQILRQVANTSWPGAFGDASGQTTGHGGAKDSKHLSPKDFASSSSQHGSKGGSSEAVLNEGAITKRAELTLARCYADFDLAKKDLKERLYESLALMDTERSELLLRKYKCFHPTFLNAESDILRMRVGPERKRHEVVGERLRSLELLYELVCFINAQNGGNNGETGSGMTGNVNGAALPTFEEIYLVEVIASLIDSSLPMRAGEGSNRLGEFVQSQDYDDQADVSIGKYDPSSGIHPSLYALHASPGQTSASHHTGTTASLHQSQHHSKANSSSPTRRGSNIAGPNAGTISHPPGLHPSSHPLGVHALAAMSLHSNGAAPIAPTTPPPSFLMLLLCLSPSVLKLKEVRESLEKWAKLCGLSDEMFDSALRMVGVDPRMATYSGRGAIKSSAGQLSPAQMVLLSEGALNQALSGGLLDAGTKSALLSSGVVLPPAPAARPLSSVILAPVALDDWESMKRGERVRQSARDLQRRVRAVRDLTTSSNASTRMALGLGGGGRGGSNPSSTTAGRTAHGASMSHSPRHQDDSPTWRKGGPSMLHKSLSVLVEEGGSGFLESPRSNLPSARTEPRKKSTGVSRTLNSYDEKVKFV